MTTETDKLADAREQARNQYDHIVELMDKLRAADDDDAYEAMANGLATDAGFTVLPDGEDGFSWAKDDGSEVNGESHDDEEAAWLACCDDNGLRPDADDVRREIEENALSVQVRSGWVSPGETMAAEEFEILLCTGGPAVRIVGTLNDYKEPDRARLECQDWFTPWTEVFFTESDTLLAFCRCFYFGD